MISSPGERVVRERFSGLLLRLRGRTGLTQRQLAGRVGVNIRSVQDWESGVNRPSAQRLQALVEALLAAGGFTAGHELDEAEELADAARHEAPRQHPPFDRDRFERRLAERGDGVMGARRVPGGVATPVAADLAPVLERRQDWGDAPDVRAFVGRADELATLRDWVLNEHCRVVGVLGMGGIGKTSLTARLAQEVAPAFQRVYWRGLRNATPVGVWLAGAIGFLSGQRRAPPAGEANQLAALLELLRERPSLLVLDNFETVLAPGQREGQYRAGFDGYGALLRAVGETNHLSCLLVTSRETPLALTVLEGGEVRTLALGGLGVSEGQVLLAAKQLLGDGDQWAQLVGLYGGNGLALKVIGESIRQVFGGDIGAFLEDSDAGAIFGGIRRLLAEQLQRSSALEQQVLRVLAVEREPVTIVDLLSSLGSSGGRGVVLEAVEALRRRSLLERGAIAGAGASFTLQAVVLEHVTDQLVEDVAGEIARAEPNQLELQPLIQAQAKEYVRRAQERLIGEAILRHLEADAGAASVDGLLLALLDDWRGRPPAEQGYGPGTVVNLLRLRRGDLRGLNLSGLALRQAYLAGVEAQDASLASAQLAEVVLAEAFTYPISVAVSGDGASLVAGTSTGEVWLWRVADRTPLLAVQGHAGSVYGIAASADGRLLASGSENGRVRLWEAPDGRLLASLEGHTGGIRGLALSADGRLVASASWDGTVRLWAAPEGRLLTTLEGHSGGVWGVAIGSEGRLVASGGQDGSVRLWGAPAGRLLATLEGHTGGVWSVALSADGQLVVSGSEDGTARLWDAASGDLLATFVGHGGGVRGVSLSADGGVVATAAEDGAIRLWEWPGGHPRAMVQGHAGGAWSVALSADGRLVASGGQDGTIRLSEAPRGRLLAALQGHTGGLRGVALSANGSVLVSGSENGTVRLWDPAGGLLLATLPGHTRAVWGVAVRADGALVASASEDWTVRLWQAPSGYPLATLRGHTAGVRAVALNADGTLLASGGFDNTIRLWEPSSGRPLAALHGHSGGVRAVALSADGRLLASSSFDRTVRLWDTTTGQALETLLGHTALVYSVALSADGRLLVSGSFDGTIRVWDATSRRLLTSLEAHVGGVRGVALSADGQLMVSGGLDGLVRLWETPVGQPLGTLDGHTHGLWGVALGASDRLVASGSFDGTIRLWDSASGELLRTVRSDRRYERVDITGLTGVTAAQRSALLALGAVEHDEPALS
jgi:WD40 repeat protein/transcriptional regulator with XRE-family HTH domain